MQRVQVKSIVERASGASALLIAVLVALLGTQAARAQGTPGQFPGPISSAELVNYAERLELSGQQRLALEPMHDDYREDFQALREGEIATFLEDAQEMNRALPTRDEVKSLMEKMDRIYSRIESLDNRFFDRMLPILTEEQAARMPRMRMLRERTRYALGASQWIAGGPVLDLSEPFFKLDLPPETFNPADTIMAGYERQLTNHAEKMHEATVNWMLVIVEAMEQAGFGEMTQEEMVDDPEAMQKMMEVMQQAWAEATERSRKIALEIRQLNARTYNTLTEMLPDDATSQLRRAYYAGAYPMASRIISAAEHHEFDRALDIEDLTDEQRDQLRSVLAELKARLDTLVNESMTISDDELKEGQTPFDFNSEEAQQRRERQQELATAANELGRETAARVAQILGEDWKQRLPGAQPTEIAQSPGTAVEREVTEESPAPSRSFSWAGRYLAPPIAERTIDRYADRLELSEGERSVLMELHRSYVERYQGLDEIERLGDAAQSLWSFDEEGNSKPAGPERVDDLAPLYRSAFDAIRALEDAFFDDMRVAVGGEGRNEIIERLRRSRMREMYIQPGENAIMFGGTKVGGVDVVELVRELELDVAQRESVRPILERYERESLALLERRWEAGFELQKASMRLTFAIRSQESDGSFEPMAYQQLQQEIVQPASKRFDDADAAVGQLNRSVLAELRDALPRAQAQALRQAHDRKAFPRIYDDPVNVDEELTAALELPDLTTEQRDQLRNLAAGYRPEYEEACHQMVELKSEHGRSMTSIQTNEWQDMQEYFQQMQKLQFERNELNFRTINRMKAILNEDQIKRIGGLPEPGEQDENPYIW